MFSRVALCCCVLLGLGSGCISVPDAVRADFVAPDGERPNNYGRARELPDGRISLEHDTPTIAPLPRLEHAAKADEDEDA